MPVCGHLNSQGLRCAKPEIHVGSHDYSTEPVQRTVCGVMWSPDPDTQYECGRKVGHRGLHLDDSQNILFTIEWNLEREIPLITGPGTEPPAEPVDPVLATLQGILSLLQERLPVPLPVCGESNSPFRGYLYCQLPEGHDGRHRSGITVWPRTPVQTD